MKTRTLFVAALLSTAVLMSGCEKDPGEPKRSSAIWMGMKSRHQMSLVSVK